MVDFVNTRDLLGDIECANKIIDRTIEEFKDDAIDRVTRNAFYECLQLVSIDLPSATIFEENAFYGCSKLSFISAYSVTEIADYSFYNCAKLVSVNLPNASIIGRYVFGKCSSLKEIDLASIRQIGFRTFESCSNLIRLIIRNADNVCDYLNSTASYDPKNANLKIYVPRALLESYKTATNWSRLVDKFVALEDYTVDGTTTGALRE